MTEKKRLADVDAEIFETSTPYDCFMQERTVAKNEAMSESRDEGDSCRCGEFEPRKSLQVFVLAVPIVR